MAAKEETGMPGAPFADGSGPPPRARECEQGNAEL